MARQILIMAKSPQEGGRYAKRAELRPASYRVVHGANQIKGVQYADVHILPSFLTSVQRHAIFAALQWARHVEYFYVDPADFPTVEEIGHLRAERHQLEDLGELTDEVLEAAYAEHEGFDHAAFERGRLVAMIQNLSDEQIAARIAQLEPVEAEKVVKAVKSAPKPRAPRKPAATSAEDFFGSQ